MLGKNSIMKETDNHGNGTDASLLVQVDLTQLILASIEARKADPETWFQAK